VKNDEISNDHSGPSCIEHTDRYIWRNSGIRQGNNVNALQAIRRDLIAFDTSDRVQSFLFDQISSSINH
jgi:hypothetical protein